MHHTELLINIAKEPGSGFLGAYILDPRDKKESRLEVNKKNDFFLIKMSFDKKAIKYLFLTLNNEVIVVYKIKVV